MLSVVIPVYNEKRNLRELILRLHHVLHDVMRTRHEMVFVNDGSTDDSLLILLAMKKRFRNIRIISFEQNLGQTTAMQRGFEAARYRTIITMDADLQNFPEDIPMLISRLNKGYDVVCGWRYHRKDRFFSKRLPSIISNMVVRNVMKTRLHDSGCSLRAYRKEAVRDFHLFGEMHRFIPVILAKQGYKVTEVKVRHSKRTHGKTKYGFRRYFKGFLDLVFVLFLSRYSRRPLHVFGTLGVAAISAGLLLIILDIIFVLWFLGRPLLSLNVGPVIFLAFMLIFFGINFIVLGIMSEMIFLSADIKVREKRF